MARTLSLTPAERREANAQAAMAAYMEHHQASLALLARITATLTNHDDAPAEGLHWGHVGDAGSIRSALQAISDQLHQEGEHAEVACLRCTATFDARTSDLSAHYAKAH